MAKKAIVLAAGFGTRLRPFTCGVPKPMLPVWGESMISRVVSALRRMGVEEIAVNCHYHHEQVEKWCQLNGCRSFYEPEILGTGGVLNSLRQWLGGDDFYLVNGDIVMENMPLLELPASDDVIAVAAVVAEGPRTVEVEPISGYVTCWRSPDAGWEGTFTYAGFSLLRSSILDYVKPEGFSSIVEAYEKAMYDGRFVKAVTSEDFLWTDAGTIDSYIEINQDGEDNAFSEIPQIKEALGDSSEKVDFIGARGSDRVFFKTADKVIVIYDDEKRKENAKYASHAKWLKKMGAAAVDVIAEFPKSKTLVLENAGKEDKSFRNSVRE
jgi:NDP-sugar pyrophosphorylase family protein